jgi:MFS family permease
VHAWSAHHLHEFRCCGTTVFMATVSVPHVDRDARRRSVVLAICCLSVFMAALDVTIVNVALPSIQRALHASVSGLQWTIDAYTLVIACLLMLSGSLADRFGRRRVFQIGLAAFSLGSLLCSVAPSLGCLIAFRGLQAVGGSMLNPVAMSIIANTFTDKAGRAKAIGMWGSVAGLSLASGPVLGGVLVSAIGWRSIFWINVPVGLITIVLTHRFIPESRAERPRRFDPPGQLLVIALLGCVTAGIIEGPRSGWGSAPIVALFAVAVLAAIALVLVESRRREPLIDMRYFRSAPFSGATLICVVALATLGGFLFLNTLYLQDVRGYSALHAGLLTIPMAATLGVFSLLSGRLVASRGPRLPPRRLRSADRRGRDPDDRPQRTYRRVVSDRRLRRLRCGGGPGQRPDHQHRALGHAPRPGRCRGSDRLHLSPDRRRPRGRGHRRDHRCQLGRVRTGQPRSMGGARRLWSDGHAARHSLNRTLGTGHRRAKRRTPGH